MISSKWALTVEWDILWLDIKALYSVSKQGNLSQMHSSPWLPNKFQIRRQWGSGIHRSTYFIKEQISSASTNSSSILNVVDLKKTRNDNPQPLLTLFLLYTLLFSSLYTPPYRCVVYTMGASSKYFTFFSRIQNVHYIHMNINLNKYQHKHTLIHTNEVLVISAHGPS